MLSAATSVAAARRASLAPLFRGATRFASSTAGAISQMATKDWANEFSKATVDLAKMDVTTISYPESADRLRSLLKTGLLRHTDLHDAPERFFLAHRILARHAPQLGPGFWIR